MTKLKYTLILLLFVLNINAQWTPLNGPFNNQASNDNRVMAIDENNIFVAVAGSKGVFKTADNGKHWNAYNVGLPLSGVGGIQILTMAIIGDNIFISTNKGLFRSNVNNCNWEALNAPFEFNYFSKMCSNGNQIFAATRKGLFVSSDNGTSWTLDKTIGEVVIWALHYDNGVLYISRDGFFSKSFDNGLTWVEISITELRQRISNILVLNNNIYVSVKNGENGNYIGGVYKSTDGGLSWKLSGKDNFQIDTLLKSGSKIFALGLHNYLVSSDEGATWQDLYPICKCFYTYGYSFNNRIVLGGYSSVSGSTPIHLSLNNGDNWSVINNNLINSYIEYVEVINNRILADQFQHPYLYSNDNGNDWNTTDTYDNFKFNGTELIVLKSNYDANTLKTTNTLLKSTDGINWTVINEIEFPKICKGEIDALNSCNTGTYKLIKVNKNEIYVGTSFYNTKNDITIYKVFKSTNNGLSWDIFLNDEKNEEIIDISIGNKISCALGKYGSVYLTKDNGINWFSPIVPNKSTSITCIAVDNNDNIYLGNGIWGIFPKVDGIFKSTDGGLTWGLLINGLNPAITKKIYAINNNLFAITTNYNNSIGNVFIYDFLNIKWKEISSKELNNAIPLSLTFNNNNVYCSTEKNGIWVNSLSTLGTENNIIKETGTIKIAPNPTDSYVLVDLGKDEDFRNFAYEVFNLLGQKMVEGNFTENTTSIPLHHFLNENGIYFMKIINKTNNSFITRKVIFNNMK